MKRISFFLILFLAFNSLSIAQSSTNSSEKYVGEWKADGYESSRIEISYGSNLKTVTKQGVQTLFNKVNDKKYQKMGLSNEDFKFITLEFEDNYTCYLSVEYKDGYKSTSILKRQFNKDEIGCISGNCLNGLGTKYCENGDLYTGEFKNSKFNGTGKIVQKNGIEYIGQFIDDIKTGTGKIFFANGDFYEGEMGDNLPNGYGVYIWGKKKLYGAQKYQGQFKDGELHGQGTKFDTWGIPYESGEYLNGTLVTKNRTINNGNSISYKIVSKGDWKSRGLFDDSKKRVIYFTISENSDKHYIAINRLTNGKYTAGVGYSTKEDGIIHKHEFSSESECIEATLRQWLSSR